MTITLLEQSIEGQIVGEYGLMEWVAELPPFRARVIQYAEGDVEPMRQGWVGLAPEGTGIGHDSSLSGHTAQQIADTLTAALQAHAEGYEQARHLHV